ncbi:MAG TPA: helix-turn-helix domain-containing protein [Candidatus Binatia bacterium]|nr:helix-turn-helix domain-containing protein [Candidatus Binatia bacterium]
MSPERKAQLLSVDEAGRVMGVSRSTVWRLIRRGSLASVRQRGRRWVPKTALTARTVARADGAVTPLHGEHPIFRLVGAGRSGGRTPGARDKHAVIDVK